MNYQVPQMKFLSKYLASSILDSAMEFSVMRGSLLTNACVIGESEESSWLILHFRTPNRVTVKGYSTHDLADMMASAVITAKADIDNFQTAVTVMQRPCR